MPKGKWRQKSYVPALEDEAIGVEHLLVELKNDNVYKKTKQDNNVTNL